MKLSIEIIEQIQRALDQTDGSEGDEGCPDTHKDIKQEGKSECKVVNPGEFREDEKSHSLVS